MLKGKLSHSKTYFDACSCAKTERSSFQSTIPARTYTTTNYERRTSQDFTTRIPKGHSKGQTDLRNFFDDLGKQIGIEKPEDWYQKLSYKVLSENGGRSLLAGHKRSPITALMTAFPECNWQPWKFNQVHHGYWNNIENQRKFFDDLGQQLAVEKLDDWYQKLSKKVVTEHGGAGLLAKHKESPITALMTAYPEHNWIPWKFKKGHHGYWNTTEHFRKFFDELGHQLGVEKLDDWYQKLSYDAIMENGGAGLLKKHKRSPQTSLMAAYPEHNWDLWKFKRVSQEYWSNLENQRKFFDDLGLTLGVEKLDDWYQKLSHEVITKHGGAGLLNKHKGSPMTALMTAYPEHNWIPWKFHTVSKGFWKSDSNISVFIAGLSEKLSIQTLDDWYRVDMKLLNSLGAGYVILKYKGLYNLLKEQYPNHPWDSKRFQHGGKKGQRWLAVTLKKMFPDEEILEDYHHPKAVFPSSQRPMQLDVFIPSRSLAFEYQGQHHFEEIGVFGPSKTYQQRDEEKRILCAANNIKLIEVPYWWNRTQESLQEIINQAG